MITTTATRSYGHRIASFAVAVILAAALGLAVGSALNSWTDEAPSRTATAGFSIDALEVVRVTRGDAVASNDESDYALRHRPAAPKAKPSSHRAPGAPQPD